MAYTCDKCGKTFRQNKTFTRHLNRKTSCVKTIFKCTICDYETKERSNMERHENRKIPCNMTRAEHFAHERKKIKELEEEIAKLKRSV